MVSKIPEENPGTNIDDIFLAGWLLKQQNTINFRSYAVYSPDAGHGLIWVTGYFCCGCSTLGRSMHFTECTFCSFNGSY